jgi:putative membrane protein
VSSAANALNFKVEENKMRSTISIALLTAATIGITAISASAANNGNGNKMTGANGTNGTISSADKRFIMDSGKVNVLEIKLGELAQKKAESAEVKSFAQRMVTDHTAAQNSLQSVAQKAGITLPTDLDSKDKNTYNRLEKLSGKQFDREYMNAMVAGHTKTANNMKHEENKLSDSDLKSWDINTLKTVEEHVKLAKQTDKAIQTANSGKGKTGGTSSHY